jgi:hypothetical protein
MSERGSGVEKLGNLPLSQLFSGPLVAAIDASVQSQRESISLLMETGFDEDGTLVTVTFEYPMPDTDPDTGEARRTTRRVEIPLLLFLTLPNLQISRIEEEFSARITGVEERTTEGATEATSRLTGSTVAPFRLRVKPASRSTDVSRTVRSQFDLNVRMVAELRNESAGMDLLERAVSNASFEPDADRGVDEVSRERITPERVDRIDRE